MLFFFQAEDGIRDGHVTGVQTCALPISSFLRRARVGAVELHTQLLRSGRRIATGAVSLSQDGETAVHTVTSFTDRSEERRVGNEGSSRQTRYSEDNSKRNMTDRKSRTGR